MFYLVCGCFVLCTVSLITCGYDHGVGLAFVSNVLCVRALFFCAMRFSDHTIFLPKYVRNNSRPSANAPRGKSTRILPATTDFN